MKSSILAISVLLSACGVNQNFSSITSQGKDDPSAQEADSSPVTVDVGVTVEASSGGLDLAVENLTLISFDITIAGCNTITHSYFNKTHAGLSFSASLSTEKLALPADDPGCYVSLSKLVIDWDGAGAGVYSTYQLDTGEIAENAGDRISGGKLVFARTSGTGGPTKVPVTVARTNWLDSVAPVSGSMISYTLVSVLKSDAVSAVYQGVIGSNPPNIPIDVFALSTFQPANFSTSSNGGYKLTLLCTEAIVSTNPKKCGDVLGEDNAAPINSNFSICAVRTDLVSEADLLQNALSYCTLNSTSSTTTALANRPASGEEFPNSAAINQGKVKLQNVVISASGTSNLDYISNTHTEMWLLMRVEANSKVGVRYWRVGI